MNWKIAIAASLGLLSVGCAATPVEPAWVLPEPAPCDVAVELETPGATEAPRSVDYSWVREQSPERNQKFEPESTPELLASVVASSHVGERSYGQTDAEGQGRLEFKIAATWYHVDLRTTPGTTLRVRARARCV